jgi:hypothetical protein
MRTRPLTIKAIAVLLMAVFGFTGSATGEGDIASLACDQVVCWPEGTGCSEWWLYAVCFAECGGQAIEGVCGTDPQCSENEVAFYCWTEPE